MSKHTPGPWEKVPHIIQSDEWWVAGPLWVYDGNNEAGLANEADARLIAAAPDLLAAGADVVRLGDEFDDSTEDYPNGWWEAFEQLRAALAKATGE